MPDAMTTTASLDSVQAAYDRLAYFALRPEMYMDGVADVKPTHQSMPGNSVKFTQYAELTEHSTSINESVDIDAVAMDDSQVTVTLAEYGNAINTTAKLRATSFLTVDTDAANLIGFDAGRTIDCVARDVLVAGSNVRYSGSGSARNTVVPTATLTAANVRRSLADLRGNNVQAWSNGYYKSFIHPDVSYDLRGETGAAAWRDPHTYSEPGAIWTGAIGAFEGFEFVETPRAKVFSDAGSSTTLTDVYVTLFLGRQAMAKAYTSMYGAMPSVKMGPVVDKLMRFQPIGWYALLGYGRFREAALRRYESASSIGAN